MITMVYLMEKVSEVAQNCPKKLHESVRSYFKVIIQTTRSYPKLSARPEDHA